MPVFPTICDCGFQSYASAKNRNKAYDKTCPRCLGEMRWNFSFNMTSDQLGEGVQGLYNHADGKKYDSKSSYYKALKEKGFVIRENPPGKAKEYTPDRREIKREIAQAIKQHT